MVSGYSIIDCIRLPEISLRPLLRDHLSDFSTPLFVLDDCFHLTNLYCVLNEMYNIVKVKLFYNHISSQNNRLIDSYNSYIFGKF